MSTLMLSAFADEVGEDFALQLNALKRNSLQYVELRSVDHENISRISLDKAKELKQRMDDAGVSCRVIGSPIGKIALEKAAEHEEALRHVRPDSRVLDIGTGSGALAVSIAKLGICSVTAVDVSDTALRVAKGNAEANGAQVRFVKSDCFSALAGETFDVIVSNPPYISREEMEMLMPEVKQEPELALFGGEDGLDFYRRISREAPAYLAEGGVLLFEIGWQQKDAVSDLLRAHIGEPFALKDYGDNWRVVGAVYRKED